MSAGAVRVAAKISSGDSRTAPQPLSLAGPMPRPHVAGGPAPALAADMQSVWLTQFIDATRVLISCREHVRCSKQFQRRFRLLHSSH
jgi:hypothetical protein